MAKLQSYSYKNLFGFYLLEQFSAFSTQSRDWLTITIWIMIVYFFQNTFIDSNHENQQTSTVAQLCI